MEIGLYLIGFIIALCIVIYIVDATHRMQDGNILPFQNGASSSPDDKNKLNESRPIYHYPRTKICPCCGAHLEQHEVLIATMEHEKNEEGKQKVYIHGCRFCHKKDGIQIKTKIEI